MHRRHYAIAQHRALLTAGDGGLAEALGPDVDAEARESAREKAHGLDRVEGSESSAGDVGLHRRQAGRAAAGQTALIRPLSPY